jgi:hypothetical protein
MDLGAALLLERQLEVDVARGSDLRSGSDTGYG